MYITCPVQWNPSCEATPFAPGKWAFKRGGLSSGVEINTFMLRFTLSSGLSRGGGLSSGWPLKRGSTVYTCTSEICVCNPSSTIHRVAFTLGWLVHWNGNMCTSFSYLLVFKKKFPLKAIFHVLMYRVPYLQLLIYC